MLELTLTSRAKDSAGGSIPMCGVPYHAVETYLARLVKKGFRVAICDQVEDAKNAKGIVRREVTRVVSPGTFLDGSYLEAREPALLAAIAPPAAPGGVWGLACLDVSTAEFAAGEFAGAGAESALAAELAVLRPREILVADPARIQKVVTGLRAARHASSTAGRSRRRARTTRCAASSARRR